MGFCGLLICLWLSMPGFAQDFVFLFASFF